jgi:hypothetical protein
MSAFLVGQFVVPNQQILPEGDKFAPKCATDFLKPFSVDFLLGNLLQQLRRSAKICKKVERYIRDNFWRRIILSLARGW